MCKKYFIIVTFTEDTVRAYSPLRIDINVKREQIVAAIASARSTVLRMIGTEGNFFLWGLPDTDTLVTGDGQGFNGMRDALASLACVFLASVASRAAVSPFGTVRKTDEHSVEADWWQVAKSVEQSARDTVRAFTETQRYKDAGGKPYRHVSTLLSETI